ncbi:MAG: helix-turn-helix domain-containing protein, partial [Candidatus Omnitrophica bacterium]|nr:helix-turn-helix domain-containing protein [Candidatus Omnitrophota bacterium]
MFVLNIRKIRLKRNITQKALADTLGVSRQALCMWEAEKRELKASTLKMIAGALNVTTDELITTPRAAKALNDPERRSTMLPNPKTPIKPLAAKPAEPKEIMFELNAAGVKKPAVTGSFINWDAKGIAMKKNLKGVYQASVLLKPGEYQYKFIADGNWWTDPANPATVSNG